mmetsp:Transcript_17849/g.20337  ORF Transcript_17849/g.20337 Transcript_17849/m.20337 type:complete len:472 (-) Transcript_17849:278-1693(-)
MKIDLIPRITGSISATASSLIIYLILRSDKKLSSIYHRIMFGMSSADILGSVAIAFTTIPMPSDFPCEDGDLFNTNDGRGSIQTCNIQGFFLIVGINVMYAYNAMLCVYYACAIAFQMREKIIHKRVEPFLHSIPMFFGLVVAIPPLFLDLYNPGPGWCTLRSIECTAKDDFDGDRYQYVRGDSNVLHNVFGTYRTISLGVWLILIVGSFSLIIRRSWRIDQELLSRNQEATNGNDGNVITVQRFSIYRQTTVQNVTEDDSRQDVTTTSSRSDFSDIQRKNQTTKLIVKQALAYTVVLVLTVLFPTILGFYDYFGGETTESYFIIHTLTAIFLPLQGFFNFVIFLWHKVHNYCRVNEEENYCSVIYLFFKGEVNEPVMLSRISMVRDEHDNLRIELQDEHRRERYYDDNLQSIPGTTNSQTDNHLSVDSQSDIRLDSFSDNGLSGFTSGKQSEGISYYSSKVDSNTSTIKN